MSWLRIGDPFVYQSPIGVCVCHFLGYFYKFFLAALAGSLV